MRRLSPVALAISDKLINISENRTNVCAVGAAVLGPDGKPVGGVGISMPDIRFDHRKVPELGELVRKAAVDIAANLASRPRS